MVQILLFSSPRYALSIFSCHALFRRYPIFLLGQALHLRRYFKGKHWNFPSKGGKILSPCRKDMFLFKRKEKKKKESSSWPAAQQYYQHNLAAWQLCVLPCSPENSREAVRRLRKPAGGWGTLILQGNVRVVLLPGTKRDRAHLIYLLLI